MRLYYNELSPYCRKLLYFLEETEIVLDKMKVEFAALEFKTLGFSTLSPTGQIPALATDFGVLSDSTVCMRYLSERFLKSDVYPVGLYERAEVDLWTEYVNQHIGRHILTLAWQKHWTKALKKEVDLRALEQSKAALIKYLPALDRHLQGRSVLVGPTLTIADINLMGFMMESKHAELDLSPWPYLARWYAMMVKRPKFANFCAKFPSQ